ncbi:transcriptional regulator [Luteimicrobium album]|uniref:Transcriptional regulator n=1 Tax=Luteimicrobium album TaxID=1054550 RepID=A0ABQ6I2W9_9MICO|nr:helix-turn-helix transcriptional regulator [Luteimicrobium album]GMA24135.1 transcriptional regulator [Luteimicrobium album]
MEAWDFGTAVRRWRDRAAPESVGVPEGRRRRAAGLRREELAGLAGISVDYLTRLEQGRAVSPSGQVVEALARALRLSDGERDVLFELAGLVAPGAGLVPGRVTPSIQRLLDRLDHTPVIVQDAAFNFVTANAPYDALMGDTSAWRGNERNGVWRNLVGPGTSAVHAPEERVVFEESLVAGLRLTASRYPADPALRRLIGELEAASPRFRELWDTAELDADPDRSRHKVIDHPAVGLITLDCDNLTVARDDLVITVYTAEPGTDDVDRLALAIVLGTQRVAG